MDPVTAFGLLVNVATLIDLGVKVIDIYKDGLGPNQTRLVESADEMEGLCQQLQSTKIVNQPTASGSIESDLQDCAKRCVEKATSLRKRLDLPTKLASKRQRALKSVRVHFSRKLPQLERELQDLRGELDTKLLVSIRENINLNALKQTERFKSLDASIQNALVRFCDSQSTALDLVLDRSTRNILDRIDEVQKTHVENKARRDFEQRKSKILKSLIYGNPFTRENDILNKHDGTFEWIFDEGPETGSTFLSWLRSDDGIFWVQGKPGSGKSTLMKFLCTSTGRIKQHLQLPATGKTPVFFSFYFWLADGAKLQNTEKGLLCSLLYQFLETSWILDSRYLTDARLRQKKTQGNWDLVELRSLVFLAADTLLADHSVCVFVDALDECQAEDLVKVLNSIKQLSSRGVKVCVSSRPEQRIINKLGSDAAEILKVDLYTKNDISTFVKDEFDAVDLSVGTLSNSELNDLADQIVHNAEGVFLWATLVAKDVCKGIENGDDFDQLCQRVNQTPGDLDALYESMLRRLGQDHDLYMAEAGFYFSLVLLYESISAFSSFFSDELPLILCLSVYKMFQRSIPGDQRHNLDILLPRVESRINVVCAGMLICGRRFWDLDSIDSSSDPPLRELTVRFVHRTARDFFIESDCQFWRSSSLSLFELWHSMTSGFLMACRFYGLPQIKAVSCEQVIGKLARSKLKPAEKFSLLLHIDKSMQDIYQAEHWLYRHYLDIGARTNPLDLLGMALNYDFDLELLDCFRQSGASLSKRYKSYLLLMASEKPRYGANAVRAFLMIGADPNQAMFTLSARGRETLRTRTSPWLEYVANYLKCDPENINPGMVQAFVENGADLKAISLWRAHLSTSGSFLDSNWSARPEGTGIGLVLLANARYVAEALLQFSLQTLSSTDLPSPYCKVLGFMSDDSRSTPTGVDAFRLSKSSFESERLCLVKPSEALDNTQSPLESEGLVNTINQGFLADSSEDSSADVEHLTVRHRALQDDIAYSKFTTGIHNFPLYPVSEELLSNLDSTRLADASDSDGLNRSLQHLLCEMQHTFLQTPVDQVYNLKAILDDIDECIQHTTSVPILTWAFENGYLINDPDPAALFPDYEKFRGEDGYIDIDALFAD
ncbi:hypothetical protein BJX65DRAFT_154111 [Aspergillus insuetus]